MACRIAATPIALLARPFEAMYRATAPVTCGVAILVPLPVPYVPPGSVERILTPGAATSIFAPGDVTGLPAVAFVLKLENVANVSSGPYGVAAPVPPARPSESASADTVATSGYDAGSKSSLVPKMPSGPLTTWPSFPDATTDATPLL